MRNKKAETESPARTMKTFYTETDYTGLYEIRFSFKKEIPGAGFLMKNGRCILEASTRDEALELFNSLPASKGIYKLTMVRRIEHGIVWDLEN